MFLIPLILHALLVRSVWESDRLLSVKWVIFRAQNWGYLFWAFREKLSYSLSHFHFLLVFWIREFCLLLLHNIPAETWWHSAHKCCDQVGKRHDGQSLSTAWCPVSQLGRLRSRTESMAQSALESVEGLLAYMPGVWCRLLAGTSAKL